MAFIYAIFSLSQLTCSVSFSSEPELLIVVIWIFFLVQNKKMRAWLAQAYRTRVHILLSLSLYIYIYLRSNGAAGYPNKHILHNVFLVDNAPRRNLFLAEIIGIYFVRR